MKSLSFTLSDVLPKMPKSGMPVTIITGFLDKEFFGLQEVNYVKFSNSADSAARSSLNFGLFLLLIS